MLSIFLVRPGCTDFDEQKRIKGSLDIPLSPTGADEVRRVVDDLSGRRLDGIYCSPCLSAVQTAAALATGRDTKVKSLDRLRNLDHGLWHGKLIEEMRVGQPKVYRQWQDHPETIRPPEGETLSEAEARISKAFRKIFRKHRSGAVAVVIGDPLASLAARMLTQTDLGDLWKSECDHGSWELLEVESRQKALTR